MTALQFCLLINAMAATRFAGVGCMAPLAVFMVFPFLGSLMGISGPEAAGSNPVVLVAQVVMMLVFSLHLRKHRETCPRWAAMLTLLLWTVPLLQLGLAACNVPPGFSEYCGACQGRLKALGDALDEYAAAHGGHYPGALENLVPDYLKGLPACPSPELVNPRARVFYRRVGLELADGYGYRRTSRGFLLWCRTRGLSGHKGVFQPWYSSAKGASSDAWSIDARDPRADLAKGPPGDDPTTAGPSAR